MSTENLTQQIQGLDLTGRKVEDFYEIGEQLGRGSFSIVKRARSKQDGKEYALKVIQRKHIKQKLLQREIEILKKVKHPNILPLYDVFENEDYVYLVLGLATGGELFDRIVERGHYTERETCLIVKQILEAVKYLHDQGVIHRDLKPENLLCSNDFDKTLHIYVSDFGLSRMFETNELITTYCGSPEYVAPEVLECGKRGIPYEKSIDLWSVGVITYILLTGFLPFYDANHKQLFKKIQNVDYTWDDCPTVSPQAKHFIEHLLVKDPKKRITAEQALEHAFTEGKEASMRKLYTSPSFREILNSYKISKITSFNNSAD